jgi:spore germination protein KA
LRFGYILLGAIAGFLGITTGLFLQSLWFVSSKSFGVPFLTPFGSKTSASMAGTLVRKPVWKEEHRPDYVNPKDVRKQPPISRGWTRADKKEGENDEE